jgi:hypothetical protein
VSPRRAASPTNAGAVALTLVIVVAVALGLTFLVRAKPAPGPFDPRSSAPNGLRGLVLLLERYGAAVHVGDDVPDAASGARVLIVGDDLDDAQRAELGAFVDAGGIAVIADPGSPYQRSPGGDPDAAEVPSATADHDIVRGAPTVFRSTVERGSCSIGALSALRGLAIEHPTAFEVPPASSSCFGGGGLAVVRAAPRGAGTVVTIGDDLLFTNRWLEYGDNAPLATALLAPTPASAVTILEGNGVRHGVTPDVGGDERLVDLVRPSVWMGLAQLAVAFVVLAVAVGVRPGRVVDEPLPSPLEGSALVTATGNLMQRAAHAGRAADLLRYDVHRRLCARFGVSPTAPLTALDHELVRRGLTAPGQVIDALSGAAPRTGAELADLGRRLAPLGALADDPLPDPLSDQPDRSHPLADPTGPMPTTRN